jgi:hypothetical protein
MHTEAERADRNLLPAIVGGLLDRNDERRTTRNAQWRQHSAQARSREAAYQRLVNATRDTSEQAAAREQSADGDSLEL